MDTLTSSQTQALPRQARELVYLDNAATSFPKPEAVLSAVREAMGHSLTVQRSNHSAPFRADEVLRRCRVKLTRFLGAQYPEEIVYTYSATDGLNLALSGMVKPGGHVLVSPLEHHSVMRPLQAMAASRGVSFETLPADSLGRVDPQAISALRRDNTCLVAINWISNVSATVQPVEAIGAVCRELGLPYLLDASQASGSHRVDVLAIGCDVMAQPAHKALFSLPGLGVLYVRRDFDLPPWRIGGTGYKSELLTQPEERPMRFESGTPNVPGIIGLDAALDWFEQTGIAVVEQRCAALTARLARGLRAVPGLRLIGPWAEDTPPASAGHLLSFTLDSADGRQLDPLVLGQILSNHYSISCRAGLHCAPTAHSFFGSSGRGGTLRLSLGYFNTEEEVDYCIASLQEAAGLL
ncbi:aminotransferase class V-fold PLP-dependent enzyme [bacterium]|nr:aminotransferase class V-fold PLP-dependent enzyme [bacterium]